MQEKIITKCFNKLKNPIFGPFSPVLGKKYLFKKIQNTSYEFQTQCQNS